MGVANLKEASPGWRPQWTFTLEEGTCRESFAWHALRQFGWSEGAIDRFHRLVQGSQHVQTATLIGPKQHVQAIPEADVHDSVEDSSNPKHINMHLNKTESRDTNDGQNGPDASSIHVCLRALEDVCGCSESDVVRFGPRDMPPAALCVGSAMLYILCLRGGTFYVGQTDHLQARITKHRQRFGSELEEILAFSVPDTAQARQFESMLQRRIQRLGVPLVSNRDAGNKRFASRPLRDELNSESHETLELRNAAQYLLRLADRLETGDLLNIPSDGNAPLKVLPTDKHGSE